MNSVLITETNPPKIVESSEEQRQTSNNNRSRSLTAGTRRLLMMGIEVLAHREREQEGLEVYVSEGRGNKSICAKAFGVIRWFLWIMMVLLNYADPIISLCYGIQNYSLKPSVVWLSLIAIIISIIYASSIKIAFSVICIVFNFILRIIVYRLRYGFEEFSLSRVFTLLSFCFVIAVVFFEMVDEAGNSCR